MERRLLNHQRKQLHDILVSAGVEPSASRWTSDQKDWTSQVCETLEIGLCDFLFCPNSDSALSIKMRPAASGGVEVGRVGLDCHQVISLFQSWAQLVKKEIETEDPWSKYSAFIPPEALSSGSDNSPFTYKEAEEAAQAITSLLSYVEEKVPNYHKVQSAYEVHFKRLAESAKKGIGRVDWSNQFVGLVISLCLALALAPEQAAGIWNRWIELITRLLPS